MASAATPQRSTDDLDFYALLGVSPFATLSIIRDAYKKLALRYHPDKNRTETATSDFQRLVVAWETLSDSARRAEYDRDFGRGKRKYQDDEREAEEESRRARQRREDVDREYTTRWRRETPGSASGHPSPGFEAGAEEEDHFGTQEYRDCVREWKAVTATDYATRLQNWTQFQQSHRNQIRDLQRAFRKTSQDLNLEVNEPEPSVVQKFLAAISRRSTSDSTQDPSVVLAQLMAARQQYIAKLHDSVSSLSTRLEQLRRSLETARQSYEDDEADTRDERIAEALEFLGPRDLNPPLLSSLDWRRRSMNAWKALAGVKRGVCFSFASSASSGPTEESDTTLSGGRCDSGDRDGYRNVCEGPWHQAGEWERGIGEYACGRCGEAVFHVIPECGSAKCPGCGMVVCNGCHRDLRLLREYEAWLMKRSSLSMEEEGSMFELDFVAWERPRWNGNKGKGSWAWHFGDLGMNCSL